MRRRFILEGGLDAQGAAGSVSRQLSNTFRKPIITSHHNNVETSGLV